MIISSSLLQIPGRIVLMILCLILFFTKDSLSGEDHTNYIAGPFENGKQVTENCLMCHEAEAKDFMQSLHWTWEGDPVTVSGHDTSVTLGKKTVLNNFCIGLNTNYPRCTSCHAGYGWSNSSFDFQDPRNIDCLICHDNTGTYKKIPTGAGAAAEHIDLEKIAQSVGPTTRQTCGNCHFYGGGGNNVKHGDLEEALIDPDRTQDVHMGGAGFTCTSCHITQNHEIGGKALSVSIATPHTVTCKNCHSSKPHEKYKFLLDMHVDRVACQTCHIPEFARANPTKLSWDWSSAGEDRPIAYDQYGKPVFDKKKGTFEWGKNVIPEYRWYNGKSSHMIIGDKIDLNNMTYITEPVGDRRDPESKIYPFKIHRAKQIADVKNSYLLPTHLFGGYWKHFDWDKSVSAGAAAYNLDYSGQYTFTETAMYWKINHMITPKEEALVCSDCHSEISKTRLDWEKLGYDIGDPRFEKRNSK